MWKSVTALIVTLIVLTPFLININEINQTKDYITKYSYRFVNPEERQKMYISAEKFDETINFFAKILIVIAAIAVLLLSLVEYVKFYKIYKEENSGGE